MKSLILITFFYFGMASICASSQAESALVLSLEPGKYRYREREELSFNIIAKNDSDRAYRIPITGWDFDGYSWFEIYRSDGSEVGCECAIDAEFDGDLGDTVLLEPGSMYGRKVTLGIKLPPDEYRIKFRLHVPYAKNIPGMSPMVSVSNTVFIWVR